MATSSATIALLRLHALLAPAHCDAAAYRDYRERARSLGFEGHIAMAEAMA
jgi:adenylate cyclase